MSTGDAERLERERLLEEAFSDEEPLDDAADQMDAYRLFGGPSPYCRHGNFVGGPGGPDYLCGACEAGE